MNTKTSHFLNRMKSSLLIGTCLLLVSTADAAAHDVEYRSYVVHRQYVRSQAPVFPHWLHRNWEFQHWYLGSSHSYLRDLNWCRIYDIYRFEEHFRLQSRQFHGKVVHDHGYRTHRAKPKKRRN